MAKSLILTLTALLFSIGVIAQENKKYWSEGKLSWSDFSLKENSEGVSELMCFLRFNTGKEKSEGITVVRYITSCYMDNKLSWVNSSYQTEQYLRFNQVIFDIGEVYRRKLQYELDRANSQAEAERIFKYYHTLCNVEIDKFHRESNKGQYLKSIEFWEERISAELNSLSTDIIPEFEHGSIGYAMHLGLGSGFFTSSLGQHFSPTFNIIYGFDFAYKKSNLFLNATLAWDKVKKDYTSVPVWQMNQKVNVAIIEATYGYSLFENARFKICPFAGLGITELTEANKEKPENRLRMVDYNLIFGINTDFKIKTRLQLVPNPFFNGVKEKVETTIRTRLYVTNANYYSDLKGYSVNFTIGFCGLSNLIKLR